MTLTKAASKKGSYVPPKQGRLEEPSLVTSSTRGPECGALGEWLITSAQTEKALNLEAKHGIKLAGTWSNKGTEQQWPHVLRPCRAALQLWYDTAVSEITVWVDGSDSAVLSPLESERLTSLECLSPRGAWKWETSEFSLKRALRGLGRLFGKIKKHVTA